MDILTAPADVPGRARRADISDRELLRHWYRAFDQEADPRGGDIDDAAEAALKTHGCWPWVDTSGVVVSKCGRSTRRVIGAGRVTALRSPPLRYVTSLTDGDLPVLFTDLANPTSSDIYQRLGYYTVEDRLEIAFRSV